MKFIQAIEATVVFRPPPTGEARIESSTGDHQSDEPRPPRCDGSSPMGPRLGRAQKGEQTEAGAPSRSYSGFLLVTLSMRDSHLVSECTELNMASLSPRRPFEGEGRP